MTNDGHPNPTSPPTPDEETTSGSGDSPFWIDELPEPVPGNRESSLSGGLSSSKAAVEVPVLSEDASRAKLRGEECILSGVEEPVPGTREAGPGKTPPIKMDEDPVLSLSKEPPLQEEIDSLRRALQRLVKSFSNTETLEEQFKLSSAINFTTASLVRLIRAQKHLRDHQPNTNEQAVDRAITAVLKEWGRI